MTLVERLHAEIRARLEGERTLVMTGIVSGLASSFDDYRYRVGRAQALADAIAAVDAALAKVTGKDQ